MCLLQAVPLTDASALFVVADCMQHGYGATCIANGLLHVVGLAA
jgi:hypothetical protein